MSRNATPRALADERFDDRRADAGATTGDDDTFVTKRGINSVRHK